MDQRIRQHLLTLESRDLTRQWFQRLHERELNARRAREINAASRQAREYFRNAGNSDYSVRPLLTFYGVASLSRALILLFKRDGGEEGLTSGHGLRTIDWGNVLSGRLFPGLKSLGDLKIEIRSGLFLDLLEATENTTALHVNSSGIDWSLGYTIPDKGDKVSLVDVFNRVPGLKQDYVDGALNPRCASVNKMTYAEEEGFSAKVKRDSFTDFEELYAEMGYNISHDQKWCDVTCNSGTLHKNPPLLVNNYIKKTFGSIPGLHMAAPFPSGMNLSQLGLVYLISFSLGMLVRYYPTHWISLIQGSTGDALWPTINRAQNLVESHYPELVIELIHHSLSSTSN